MAEEQAKQDARDRDAYRDQIQTFAGAKISNTLDRVMTASLKAQPYDAVEFMIDYLEANGATLMKEQNMISQGQKPTGEGLVDVGHRDPTPVSNTPVVEDPEERTQFEKKQKMLATFKKAPIFFWSS